MPTRIDKLLERQAHRLSRLSDEQVLRMVDVFDTARRELRERMEAMVYLGADKATPWTAQHTRTALALAEDAVSRMVTRMGGQLGRDIEGMGSQAVGDALDIIRTFEPEFKLTGVDVEVEAIARITELNGLALHKYSLDRYGRVTVDAIQLRIAVAMAKGERLDAVIDAVASANGVMQTESRERCALIARMETYRAYNQGHVEAVKAASARLDGPDGRPEDPLLKKIVEIIDHRNHPASLAANGRTAWPGAEFEVPTGDILAAYHRMFPKRKDPKISGMVWRREGETYKGSAPPLHFNDRSRVVPFRKSWEGSRGARSYPPPERPAPPPAEPPLAALRSVLSAPQIGEIVGDNHVGPTLPSRLPDPRAMPRGAREVAPPGAHRDQRADVEAQWRGMVALSRQGFDVESTPNNSQRPTQDTLIEGRRFEFYRPEVANFSRLRTTLRRKIRTQAARFVIQERESEGLTLKDARSHIRAATAPGAHPTRVAIRGLKEVWYQRLNGDIVRLFVETEP